MKFPRVQFVSAPSLDADVRFDFNAEGSWSDDRTWPNHEGFSLGVPSLEGDPDAVGIEYGLRELEFNLIVRDTKSGAAATMSRLSRELLRNTNWLLFQLDDLSAPAWFKTYRSSPQALDFEFVRNGADSTDLWGIGILIDADPFASGELVTHPTVTIANDPAAGTNPVSVVLPEILGDAPAPVAMWALPSAPTKSRMLLSIMGSDDVATSPVFWQSSALTAGTDTGSSTTAAGFSGGSYVPITFTTNASMVARLSGNLPVAPPPGKYKVLARVSRSDTTSVFDMKFATGFAGESYEGSTVRLQGTADAATWATVVDLGEFQFPVGGGTEPTVRTIANYSDIPVTFSAARISGTGSLRVDYFLAVPVQLGTTPARSLLVDDDTVSNVGVDVGLRTAYYADGEAEMLAFVFESYSAPGSLTMVKGGIPSKGDFPQVRPGVRNVLHVAPHVDPTFHYYGLFNSGTNADTITLTTDVSISYRPRWLYLGAS